MHFYRAISETLGLENEPRDLTFLQVSLRGIVVFIVAVIIVRVANKRFLSKMSALDAVLGFIIASMLARAVNGSASFFPTLGCGFVLIALHGLLGVLGFYSKMFGVLVKGKADILVKDGKCNRESMRKNRISEDDLLEELRLNGQVDDIKKIQLAVIERNGEISAVRSDK